MIVDLEHEKHVGLKLRINGTFCNLDCYMCTYNSSTRRNELKVFSKRI